MEILLFIHYCFYSLLHSSDSKYFSVQVSGFLGLGSTSNLQPPTSNAHTHTHLRTIGAGGKVQIQSGENWNLEFRMKVESESKK